MDLGCLDLGCISVEKHSGSDVVDSGNRDPDEAEKVISASKPGKSKSPKGTGQSTLNALNKFTSQIKKPSHRKGSPLNWFPRKKADYLKKKIKMLQEVDGMNLTLDETLGDSNPHYSRVLREKIALREAAHEAMEARRAALVEASWCRILKAARIKRNEAEAILVKAEKSAAEAFEAATAMGVIMYDTPSLPRKFCQIETSSGNEWKSTTHTVTTSLETAFEVDKQVAAAVKTAFIRLANCSSFNKNEIKELLRKISQNPDDQESLELSAECESESGLELESISQIDCCGSQGQDCKLPTLETKLMKCKRRQSLEKYNETKIVDLMLERLKCLNEDELSSLATIVATCGLNAALAEIENSKLHDSGSAADNSSSQAHQYARRMSSVRSFMDGKMRRKQVESELPSLDKFLVKHVTKLEREVQEAKNRRKESGKENLDNAEGTNCGEVHSDQNVTSCVSIPDLGSILVKHSSKLEKEIEEAKKTSMEASTNGRMRKKQVESELPSLDKFFVKHMTKLEREVQEAKNRRKESGEESLENAEETSYGEIHSYQNVTSCVGVPELGSNLVKHSSKLEKEIEEAKKNVGKTFEIGPRKSAAHSTSSEAIPDLGSMLIKHSSRLEKEVQEAKRNFKDMSNGRVIKRKENVPEGPSLDKVLVKHVSRLEREVQEAKSRRKNEAAEDGRAINMNKKMDATTSASQSDRKADISDRLVEKENVDCKEGNKTTTDKKECEEECTREILKQLEQANQNVAETVSNQDFSRAGNNEAQDSLDKILVKPVHRLEREKLQALSHGSNYRNYRCQDKLGGNAAPDCEGLDKVLVKHVSRLEKEKMAFRSAEVDIKVKRNGRNLHTQNMNEEGSLDEILVRHKSRLEKEKAASAAHETGEQGRLSVSRREARERELQEAWGGLSLGNSIRPHLSKLEKDKAAWIKAEEAERRSGVEE